MGKDKRQISHSQNFLKSPEFVAGLIERVHIGVDDLIVEIGPGRGTITAELSKKAKKVIGVELDPDLARSLKVGFLNHPNVEIVEADFLRWSLPRQSYKVFANIPFNMTADMVNKLLSSENSPEATFLIMQDKAAGRFMGQPVGPNSQSSILLQPFYDMSIVTRIDKRMFDPVPNINAVLARFEKKDEPLVDIHQQSLYRDFVVYGYNQWKPTLLESFKGVYSDEQLDRMARNFNIARLKPSELTLDQWIAIFETFLKFVPDNKKELVKGAEKRLKLKQKGMQKQHRTRETNERGKLFSRKSKRR